MKKRSWKRLSVLLLALAILVLTAGYNMSAVSNVVGKLPIWEDISDILEQSGQSSGQTSSPAAAPESPAPLPGASTFAVHFIDVGQADAALVLCDDHAMLIDGGNAADSNLIYAYLEKLSLDYLDYIVCTHAHEDHVGGLSGALRYASVGAAFSPVTDYNSKAFRNFSDSLQQQKIPIIVPCAGDTFSLGSSEVQILGPINKTDETNNTSIVLRIVYGNTSFLFAGDAEREEEQDILDAGYTLKSTVLKVGHHGSSSFTSYVWLREIMPEYAVISVGKGNSYRNWAQRRSGCGHDHGAEAAALPRR